MVLEILGLLLPGSTSGFFFVLFSIILSGYILTLKDEKKNDSLYKNFSNSLKLGLQLYSLLWIILFAIILFGWTVQPCTLLCAFNNFGAPIEYLYILFSMLAFMEIILAVFSIFFSSIKLAGDFREKIIQLVISFICVAALISTLYFTAFSPGEFTTKIHPFPNYYCDMNETNITYTFHNNTKSTQYFRDIIFECDGNTFHSDVCQVEREIDPDKFISATCDLDVNYSNCYLNDVIIGTRPLGYSHKPCK
jgi:hypothetical protein